MCTVMYTNILKEKSFKFYKETAFLQCMNILTLNYSRAPKIFINWELEPNITGQIWNDSQTKPIDTFDSLLKATGSSRFVYFR